MRGLLRWHGHVAHSRGHLFGVEEEGILALDLRKTLDNLHQLVSGLRLIVTSFHSRLREEYLMVRGFFSHFVLWVSCHCLARQLSDT
jgi:hypothetical protein